DISATGTPSGTTYLRGDGQWVTPPNTTYSAMSQAEMETGTATTSRVITAQRLKQAIAYHPPAAHSHAIADVTGLQTALDGKSNTGHGHTIADVTGLQAAIDDTVIKSNTNTQTMQGGLYVSKALTANQSIVVNGGGILNGNNTGNPGALALYINSPAFTDLFGPPVWSGDTGLDVAKINGLTDALAGKSDTGHAHAATDVTSGTFATARIPNLAASKITSGTFAPARLGTCTPSASNFLRGDGQWATPSASATWGSITGTLSDQT